MKNKNEKVIIIGDGITGLCVGYWLKKKGIKCVLLAKDSIVGGTIKSVKENGFLYETGANTALETTPLFKELLSELSLENEFVYANPQGKNRYVIRDGKLISMPMNPAAFIKSKLFSTSAKIEMLKDIFVGQSDKEESVADFVIRRLGREFLDYAVDPFIAGVYAGKAENLSVQVAFPKLYDLEKKYGGLIKGLIKGKSEREKRGEKAKNNAETFSFLNGMQVLPNAIAKNLGKSIVYNAKVKNIKFNANKNNYSIEYTENKTLKIISASNVVFAVPAYDVAPIIKSLSKNISQVLESIYYPPIVSLFMGFNNKDIGRKLDGFGFLVPSKENKKILGCLWNSSLFDNRAPYGMSAINAFIGGSRQPELTELSDANIVKICLEDLKTLMHLKGKPIYLHLTRWKKAIPQYEVGYTSKMNALKAYEDEHSGLIFAGNYRGGISVGDCVKYSYDVVEKIINNMKKQ